MSIQTTAPVSPIMPDTSLLLFYPPAPIDPLRNFSCTEEEPQKFAEGLSKALEFAETPHNPFFVKVYTAPIDKMGPGYLEIICNKVKRAISVGVYINNLQDINEEAFEALAQKLASRCISLTVTGSPLPDRIFNVFATQAPRLLDLEILYNDHIMPDTLRLFAKKNLQHLALNGLSRLSGDTALLDEFGRDDMQLRRVELGDLPLPSFRHLIKECLREIHISDKCSETIDSDLAFALDQPNLTSVHVAGIIFAPETYELLSRLSLRIQCLVEDCYSKDGSKYKKINTDPSHPAKKMRTAAGGGGGGSA